MLLSRHLATCALAATCLVGVGALGAAAHPFGPPLTADVTAHGSTVEVTWSGAEDDWMALGELSGAFAAPSDQARTGTEILMEAPEVRDYLLEHVTVHQDNTACGATWEGIEDLLDGGALLHFECAQPVASVEVEITALTDVNQAYRTVVTAGGEQTLFTAVDPRHTLDLTAAATSGGGDNTPVLVLSSAGALVLAVGLVWGASARHRTRRTA